MTGSGSALVEAQGCFDLGDSPFCVAWARLKPDQTGRRRLVSGRGRDPTQALRSALLEAAERTSAVHRGDEVDLCASFGSMGDLAVDPRALLLISPRQYRERMTWNRSVAGEHALPAPFDPQLEIDWLEANAVGGPTRYVPAAHCLLAYPGAASGGFPASDSSGLAAGATVELAVVGGFLELVERDAVALWWYGRISRPAPVLPKRAAPLFLRLAKWLGARGRRLHLIDLTQDFRIPVIAAISFDENGRDLAFGFAASFGTGDAAESAMGELVQFELSRLLRREARKAGLDQPPDWLDWCASASLEQHPHLIPSGRSASRSSIAPTIERCAALCEERGLQLLFVDLTRKDIGVPVAKAVVPGLRPLWPRFAPGRLFDVPVAMGWRDQPSEDELHEAPPILY